jgi:hypothetical protein
MLRIFIGYDPRQALSYNVLQFSILRRATIPVSITPLVLDTLPIKRQGLTPFTWSRFLVPWLCDYEGDGLFLDADMACLGDVAELMEHTKDLSYAAWVSKNEKKFEWASAIFFECDHPSNRILTPEYIETARALHGMQWLKDDEVGDLPREWNHLAGYDAPDAPDAKMVHFTQGLPIYEETKGSPYREEWLAEHKAMNHIESWQALMGNSVHAAPSKDRTRLVARLHPEADLEALRT